MANFTFPFPGRELAHEELKRDLCYERIPAQKREELVELAWARGEKAAWDVWAEYKGEKDFATIVKKSGLTCKRVDTDRIVGNQRYFSEYLSGRKMIYLYTQSIQYWAEENNLTVPEAESLILSHEYYHFLECTRLGLTSRIYQVPMLQIGGLKIGRTGIRALSEIAAHAFARTYAQALHDAALEEHRRQI